MSEVVENVGEQQNSAPSNEAAQSTEALSKEITHNVEEAVPAANKTTPNAAETGESLQKLASEEPSTTSPKVDNKKTPVKRTRMSFIERAQKESEELVRTLGGSLEMEGGRKTRSSTRGTPTRSATASTPPPVKKSRASPASGGASTPTRGRGRGRKIDTTADGSAEEESSPRTSKKKTPAKSIKSAAKESLEDNQDDEKKDVGESEKEADDDSKPATHIANDDNVESEATAENISAQTKAEKVLDEDEKENSKEIVADKDEAENGDNKKEPETVDKTDSGLAPLVEETQSQVAAETKPAEEIISKEPENVSHVEKVIDEPKNDSPMETEEAKTKEIEEEEKQNVENKNAVEAVKEPTPEPMEVDSNSKSNEAFEIMDDEVAEVIEKPQTSALAVNAETSTNTSNLNNVNTVEKNIQQNSIPADGIAALSSNSVENNITGANLINEPTEATNVALGNFNEKGTEETTPAANNDLNKTENDLCEPKIASSPPISAANDNGSVTTPQTCN